MVKPKIAIQDIQDNEFSLVLLSERHLKTTLEWRNRDDVRIWFNNSDTISPEAHERWFNEYKNKQDDLVFIALERGTMTPMAQIALYNIDLQEHTAEFGRLICSPNFRGTGLPLRICNRLFQYAKDSLNITEINLEVIASNDRAISLYQRLGFEIRNSNNQLTFMTKAL